MGRSLSYIGLLIVLVLGAWLYTRQAKSVMPEGAGNIRAVVDVTGVKNDLLAIANAERSQFALEGRYLPLDELRDKGVIHLPSEGRGHYTYAAEVSGNSFRVVATYNGPPDAGAPRILWVDESMQIHTE